MASASMSESDEDSEYDLSNPETKMDHPSIDEPSELSDEDKVDVSKSKRKAKGRVVSSYEHSDTTMLCNRCK